MTQTYLKKMDKKRKNAKIAENAATLEKFSVFTYE
jgi:hypothetical protein